MRAYSTFTVLGIVISILLGMNISAEAASRESEKSGIEKRIENIKSIEKSLSNSEENSNAIKKVFLDKESIIDFIKAGLLYNKSCFFNLRGKLCG